MGCSWSIMKPMDMTSTPCGAHRHDVLDVRQGLERALYRMGGDLSPQLQLQAILPQKGLKMLLQCGPEFPRIIRTRKAQRQLRGHRSGCKCDGLHSLRLSQSLAKEGVCIGVWFFADWVIRGA